MTQDPVEVVREVVGLINSRSLQAHAGELIDSSFIRHDLVDVFPESRGPGGASGFVGMIVAAMPDFWLDIEDIFGAGDRVTVLLRMTGTHTGEALLGQGASGRSLSAKAVFVYRVSEGRLKEAWQMIDGLAFRRLVGLVE